MVRTTGMRQVRFLLGVAAVVVAVSVAALLKPPPMQRGDSPLDRELAVIAPLHDLLPESAFAALLTARSAPDLRRNIEYIFVTGAGQVVVGSLPPTALRDSADSGFLEYDATSEGPRRALRRCFANGDCLIVGEVLQRKREQFRHVVFVLTGSFLVGIFVAVLLALQSAHSASRDLRKVAEALRRLLEGDLEQRLPVKLYTGMADISADLNRLLERIEHLTFATRTMVDSTAHDLRAPLYRLRNRLEQGLLPGRSDGQRADTIDGALQEVERIEATLDALLRITLAESGTASMAPVDAAEIVADLLELYRPSAEDRGLALAAELEGGVIVPANAQLLAQAVANLLDNAIKYTPAGGRIDVKVGRRAGEIVIVVADSGPGIAAADRGRAMERSRRLSNATGTAGSGLGLALVVAVARLQGGQLRLGDNAPGLIAEVALPLPNTTPDAR